MDRTAINKFAVWARREMVSRVSQRAAKYGITEENTGNPNDDNYNGVLFSRTELRQRVALIEQIQKKGYQEIMDEVAYTWFNRFTALRFMEVNGYLPSLIRIFTDENNNFKPQILTEAINIELDGLNKDKVYEYKNASDDEGLYKYLIITQCNALNKCLPMMFQKISDYTELLFPDNLLREGSVIQQMIELIPEDDWKEQVQIIGWLYQYYISEKKDEVFKAFKEKNLKATAKEIPAATQLFTPDWIVRYLVDNSLGRLWVLNRPSSTLAQHMSYYIKPCDVEPDFIKLESPEEIKLCDPCCGSGHMLTYAFDLLFEIYAECGYTIKDAVEHIIKDNLYGIELDNRAGQLAYFALMMKAREKYRRFFSSGVQPNICVLYNISFSDEEIAEAIGLFNRRNDLFIPKLLKQYEHADTLGSLITPCVSNIDELKEDLHPEVAGDLFSPSSLLPKVKDVLRFSEFLRKKYHVVITNPPYLAPSSSDAILQNFAKKEYPNSKTDTGTMFIERNFELAVENGYLAMVTLQSWMFLSSFEKLRESITTKKTILSMAHIGSRGFDAIGGEVVSTTAYVLANNHDESYKGQYIRLVDGNSEAGKMQMLEKTISNHDCGYYFEVDSSNFAKIPGSPIAYWASEELVRIFKIGRPLSPVARPCVGLQTGDNGRFVRIWHEISLSNMSFDSCSSKDALLSKRKWFPFSKGGEFRKWYGNNYFVINWSNNGEDIKNYSGSVIRNENCYFIGGLSWSDVSTSAFGARLVEKGFIFDTTGPTMIVSDSTVLTKILGYINSKVFQSLLDLTCSGIHYNNGVLAGLPQIETDSEDVVNIVMSNVKFSKQDWDSFETSWDFKRSPLLAGQCSSIRDAYIAYRDKANADFYQLKANEEELNRIFIDIYGLQDELKPEEDEKMVSIHRIYDSEDEISESMKKSQYALTKKDVIEDFISYAVGCMFGRYSLDTEGLAYAGGPWNPDKYSSFIPDRDNVIPVISDEWFTDDIVFRFREFVKAAFGEASLSANMKFIEDALGMSVRNYFTKEFYNQHLKVYKKRPIYWMFSSPKGYFKALVYLHRYNENTATVVLGYLRQMRSKLSTEISALERENNSRNAKTLVNYRKIAEDLDDYERILYPIAMENISLDLDDGVKVNYTKLGDALKKVPGLEKTE